MKLPQSVKGSLGLAAGLFVTELGALTWLSQHSQPPLPVLLITYGVAFLAYAALLAWRPTRHLPLWLWFAAALLLRLPWLLTDVSLSDDVWRYLHDGRAQLAGVNPFRYAPADSAAAAYAGPEYDLINNPELPTIYPPFAQLAFAVAARLGATVLAWKLVLLVFDLGIGAALLPILRRRGLAPVWITAYLLHPLPVIEFAGNGHVDAIGICLLVLALAVWVRHPVVGGAALAGSIAAKYLSAPLLPFFLRHAKNHFRVFAFAASTIAVLVLLYLPFTDPLPFGSLGTFTQTFEFNGSLAALVQIVASPVVTRTILAVGLLAVLAVLWIRREPVDQVAYVWIGAVLLASPIVHPWYVTWLVPFFAFRLELWAFVWTGTVLLAYAVLPGWWADGVWHLPLWVAVLEYAPVYLFLTLRILTSLDTARAIQHPARENPAESTT